MCNKVSFALLTSIVVMLLGMAFRVPSMSAMDTFTLPQAHEILPCSVRSTIDDIAISHDDQLVLASWSPGEARIWRIDTGEAIATFQSDENPPFIYEVAFSPDDSLVATSGRTETKVWNVNTGTLLWEFPRRVTHDDATYVEFLPNNEQLMTSGLDGASIWDLTTGEEIHFFPGLMDHSLGQRAALSPEGLYVITSDYQQLKAFIWSVETGDIVITLPNTRRSQMPISFASASEIAFNEGHALSFWNIQSRQNTGSLQLGEGFTKEWRFSPDGNYVLIFRDLGRRIYDYATELWDVGLRQKVLSFDQPFLLENFIFLPNGNELLFTEGQNRQRWASILDLPSQTVLHSYGIDTNSSQAVTSDGDTLLTGSYDGVVTVWDLQTGEFLRNLC